MTDIGSSRPAAQAFELVLDKGESRVAEFEVRARSPLQKLQHFLHANPTAVPARPAEASPNPPAAPPSRKPETRVVSLPQRTHVQRQWNIWDLERLARAEASAHPERRDEWAFLFVHLRQFANADGELPVEFDSLVRESFGSLLERQPIR